MRYVATVRFDDGRECVVFPRGRKSNTYPTVRAAENRLMSWSKSSRVNAQGRVKLGDEIVLTVAL
jgi:hypothetical protein